MTDDQFELICQTLGSHCGINADWSSYAWYLCENSAGSLYLTHCEDADQLHFCLRSQDSEGETILSDIYTFTDDFTLTTFLAGRLWEKNQHHFIGSATQ